MAPNGKDGKSPATEPVKFGVAVEAASRRCYNTANQMRANPRQPFLPGVQDVAEIQRRSDNPMRSPSYPQRIHVGERARFRAILETWEDRIRKAHGELAVAKAGSPRMDLYAQMLGARDQIADAARRLPMEVNEMYHEDHHRLDEAVAALARLFARWSSTN